MDNNRLKKDIRLLKKDVPDNAEERGRMEEILLDNFCASSSSDDCTGLIPSGNGKDTDSYHEIYPFSVPIKEKNKSNDKNLKA